MTALVDRRRSGGVGHDAVECRPGPLADDLELVELISQDVVDLRGACGCCRARAAKRAACRRDRAHGRSCARPVLDAGASSRARSPTSTAPDWRRPFAWQPRRYASTDSPWPVRAWRCASSTRRRRAPSIAHVHDIPCRHHDAGLVLRWRQPRLAEVVRRRFRRRRERRRVAPLVGWIGAAATMSVLRSTVCSGL